MKPDAMPALPVVPHAPSHSDESRRRQYFSPGALRGEQHTPGNEPEGSCTSDLASGGGASKPTGSSSCHEVLCRPVHERRNNEVACSGQRYDCASRSTRSRTLVWRVRRTTPHSHKRQETLARWPSDRGRAAGENISPRKSEHGEEEYGAWCSCHRQRVMHAPWRPSRLPEGLPGELVLALLAR